MPADVGITRGNKHNLRFVPDHIENTVGRRKKTTHADKVYTSAQLRQDLQPKLRFDEDKYQGRFKAFVYLALIIILIRN